MHMYMYEHIANNHNHINIYDICSCTAKKCYVMPKTVIVLIVNFKIHLQIFRALKNSILLGLLCVSELHVYALLAFFINIAACIYLIIISNMHEEARIEVYSYYVYIQWVLDG